MPSHHHSSSQYTRGNNSSSSYYKRRSRSGYISRLISKIKRYLREIMHYLRKNPLKVVLPLVMALVSSGALVGVAKRMGVSLPSMLGPGGGLGKGIDAFGGGMGGEGLMSGALKMASTFL